MTNGNTKQQIIVDITSYINQRAGSLRDWYVGIASDARKRLFNDHAVNEKSDLWIFRTAESSNVARDVEDYFLRRGAQGGPGGGDGDTDMVYAYRINSHTRE